MTDLTALYTWTCSRCNDLTRVRLSRSMVFSEEFNVICFSRSTSKMKDTFFHWLCHGWARRSVAGASPQSCPPAPLPARHRLRMDADLSQGKMEQGRAINVEVLVMHARICRHHGTPSPEYWNVTPWILAMYLVSNFFYFGPSWLQSFGP